MHVYGATKKTDIFDISPRKDIKNKRQTGKKREKEREIRINPFPFKTKTSYFYTFYIFLRIYQGLKINVKYYFK